MLTANLAVPLAKTISRVVRRTPIGVHARRRVGAQAPDSAPRLHTVPTCHVPQRHHHMRRVSADRCGRFLIVRLGVSPDPSCTHRYVPARSRFCGGRCRCSRTHRTREASRHGAGHIGVPRGTGHGASPGASPGPAGSPGSWAQAGDGSQEGRVARVHPPHMSCPTPTYSSSSVGAAPPAQLEHFPPRPDAAHGRASKRPDVSVP
jgi:hypothetical protein